MNRVACRLLAALALVALPACSTRPAPTRRLAIGAAASLRYALEAVGADFAQRYRGVVVEPVYASSEELSRLARSGAPLDLVLLADEERPRRLAALGLGDADGPFVYGAGRLALWVAHGRTVTAGDGLAVVARPEIERLGLADGHLAPYGALAAQALGRSGLRPAVERKLVVLPNADRVAQAAAADELDAALLPLSLALAPPLAAAGEARAVSGLPDQRHAGLILARAREPGLARTFRHYLSSQIGRAHV